MSTLIDIVRQIVGICYYRAIFKDGELYLRNRFRLIFIFRASNHIEAIYLF